MSTNKNNSRELIDYNKTLLYIGTVILFIIFSLLAFGIISIFNTIETEQNRSEFILEKKISIEGAAVSIQETFSFIADDLLMLSEYMLATSLDESFEDSRRTVEQMFISIAEISQKYDQIRFIDAEGMEQVRINYNYGLPNVAPKDELQNKHERYYFSDSINLKKRQIYVSILDLNIEHGEIEIPYKPMIRFSTPVIDDSGNCYGVIVLNYLAEHILDLFRQMFPEQPTHGSSVMMLNSDGYFFVNEAEPEAEFAFMFPEKSEMNIKFSSDSLWKQIISSESGSFSDNSSLFVFSHFHPLENNWVSSMDNHQAESHHLSPEDYFWIILSRMPNSYFKRSVVPQTALGKIVTSISLLFMLFISFLLSAYKEARRVDLHNTRVFARYDLMTKLIKREYGLNQLELICNRKKQENGEFAILFLDLDKFKPLNDTYGHKAGDHCLSTVGNRIKSSIRDKDIAIRLGGDEFLIIIDQWNDCKNLIEIAQRIKNEIIKPISFENISFSVGVSIGIARYPSDQKTPDGLITYADNAMYKAKNSETGISTSCN